MGVYVNASRECGYTATYFLQKLHRYGGLGTARRLLQVGEVSGGLTTLSECGCQA